MKKSKQQNHFNRTMVFKTSKGFYVKTQNRNVNDRIFNYHAIIGTVLK